MSVFPVVQYALPEIIGSVYTLHEMLKATSGARSFEASLYAGSDEYFSVA